MTDPEVAEALAGLPGWTHRDGKIHRRIRFAGFAEAFAFMTRVAFEAERNDHHPEWSNVYDTVEIALATHDADGITQADIDLASAVDRILASAWGVRQ